MKINTFLFALAFFVSGTLCAQPSYTLADTTLAKRYLEETGALIGAAKYDAALGKLDTAAVILEGAVGKEDTTYAKVLHQKGRCFYYKGDYDRAAELNERALEIRLKTLGLEHLEVAASFNNIGNVYYAKGDYDQAANFYQKALEIRLKTFDQEHVEVANSFNNLGNVYYEKGDYDRAIQLYQKALDIRLKILGSEHIEVAKSFGNLGNVYRRNGDYDRAIEFYQKALKILSKALGGEHIDVAVSFENLGLVYLEKGDYDRAGELFQKTLKIKIKQLGTEHPRIARTFENIGLVCESKGDYDRAIEFYQMALKIRLKAFGLGHPAVAKSFGNLGLVYYSKGDYDQADEFLQKALEIQLATLGTEHQEVAASFSNLGLICAQKGDFNKAYKYQQKALEIRLKTLDSRHPDVAVSYCNVGDVFLGNGDYGQANEYHQRGLEIRLKAFGLEHPDVAAVFNSLGATYKYLGDFDKAEFYIQKALHALRYTGPNSFQQIKSIPVLLETLTAKGSFYKSYYTAIRDQKHLHTAHQSFFEALVAINYQRETLENPSSKSTLSKQSAGVYEGGIATNYLLHQGTDSLQYLHEAFQYAEQSKALSLYESMKNTDALHLAGIPDSLLQKEYDLRVDIAFYEKRRQEFYSEGKEETDSTVLSVSSKLFDQHRSYEALIDTFEIRYPDYYRLKYDFRTEDVPSVQRDLLQPDQALLEYYVGDRSVFIFLVKKDDYRVFEVKKDFPLEDWVLQLRHGIYGYRMDSIRYDPQTALAAKEYTEAAWLLYDKLLAPVDSLLPLRVVIVPDGVLGYVPFEALLREKPALPHRFHTHAYFCLQHDLSYCYSATLLREMVQKQHKKEPKDSLVAFAPFYQDSYRHLEDLLRNVILNTSAPDANSVSEANRKDLKPLPKSGEEVFAVSKIWGGSYLINADATELKFNQMAADYRILHLATHGQADSRAGDYSYLAFAQVPDSIENEQLYVREIYNLSLNADLVTLSACETGIGELQRGEGIISLARAFSYAGAKSIVTTLWTVEDEKTKDLMIAFYLNLKKGMTKDAALAQARRNFLKGQKGPNASPYYWAGFVAIGDMKALKR